MMSVKIMFVFSAVIVEMVAMFTVILVTHMLDTTVSTIFSLDPVVISLKRPSVSKTLRHQMTSRYFK